MLPHSTVRPPPLARLAVGRYWSADYEQRCYRGRHLTLALAFGVPGILLFAFGMPMLSVWWLWRNKAQLHDPAFMAVHGTLYQVRGGA